MTAPTTLLHPNHSQAVRLSEPGAFDSSIQDVAILPDGPRSLIVPAGAAWDDFFEVAGVDLGERGESAAQARDDL